MKELDNKELDIRDFDELENAFYLADSIVTKNYLSELGNYNLIKPDDEIINRDICENASLFKIDKIVYDKNENNLQKLINTYASCNGFKGNIVMIINSNGINTNLYLGLSGASSVESARTSTTAFSNIFLGNFAGSEAEVLDNEDLRDLLRECTIVENVENKKKCVSSVSGVGSAREKEDIPNENFIQGIEKMIDAMQGKAYSAIFIANYIDSENLLDLRAEYELLYSKLVPFLKSELSFNESTAEGVSKTISKSFSTTLTNSISKSLSAGTTETKSHTEGRSYTNTDTLGGNVNLGVRLGKRFHLGVGGQYSHSFARTKSLSDTTSFGITKTETDTKGESKAETVNDTESTGTSTTETLGRGLQITYLNKSIQGLLDRIDEQLERLKEGENYGIFATAGYFLATDPSISRMAASAYKGLINGNCTHVENSQIHFWAEEDKVDIIKDYLYHLQHPVFAFPDNNNVVTAASVVSGRELAIQMGIPKKSVPGVSVVETAAFGRNIKIDNYLGNNDDAKRFIEFGNIYHMGRDESIPVNLNLDSLTMHTFITGSTGKGKSNAIYTLLEKIMEKNKINPKEEVSFLIIEPAKGEYKDVFGNYPNVSVYGTNKKKMDILRINPFSFPEDIDVLEHIDRLIEIFNVCWPMYAAMPAILKDAIERAYQNAGWDLNESECKYKKLFGTNIYPSFIDVLNMINVVMEESKYSSDSKGDYTGALSTRIKSLTNGIYGQIFSANELTSAELFDSNVIVDLSRVGSVETKSLIMGLLILKMQEYRMSSKESNNSKLKHLTVLEEAHNLLKRTSTEQSSESSNLLGKSVEMLANSIAEMRTYGEGFVIADQAPGLLDMSVIRNTNTKIILGLPDLSDRELVGKAASLNDNQIIELSKLKTGVAAVYQNNWIEPVLCHIKPSKSVNGKYKYTGDNQNQNQKLYSDIIDYLMLSPMKKREKDKSNEISELEKSINKLQISTETKVFLMKYFKESDDDKINRLRQKIVYGVFNSETAMALSNSERHDMSSWYNTMIEKLEPNIDSFEQIDKDRILSLIAIERAEREKNKEIAELRDNLAYYIKPKKGE